jgi:glutathione S-transferase
LPAIVDDGEWVLDSWLIAEYLDEKYPDRPTLIGDPSVKVCGQMLEQWLWSTAIGPWMTCYLKSYRDRSLECDHAYVTETRERMFGGQKLEDIIIGREDRLPQIPPKLELMRSTLREPSLVRRREPQLRRLPHACGVPVPRFHRRHSSPPRRRSAARLDRPRLRPLRRARPPPGHVADLRPPEARARSRAVRAQPAEWGLTKRNTGPQSTSAETARLKGQTA